MEWAAVLSAAVSAFFTALLALMAWHAWKTAKATLEAARESAEAARAANEQARRDSIEQTRPYVYVEIVPSLAGVASWDIRIVNSGRSAARSLLLDYSAWPETLDDLGKGVKTLFTTPRTLPPGCSIRAFWRLEPGQNATFSDGTTYAGLPKTGMVTVLYTSGDPSLPNYTDQFSIMIDQSGMWPVSESGPQPGNFENEDLKKLYKLGGVIARRIGDLGR